MESLVKQYTSQYLRTETQVTKETLRDSVPGNFATT
jgi:hypothetical protein